MTDERKVCVILPIYDDKSFRTTSRHLNYESSIESTCFAKPLIIFTIKALKRIPWIGTIILCSSSGRQEQIQSLISEHLPDYEGLKYLCAENILSKKSPQKNSANNKREITLNRLLKHCCSFLNGNHDIVVVHDPNMPGIDEKLVNNLCTEAFRHGAACLSTTVSLKNSMVKIEDCNIEEEEIFEQRNLEETFEPTRSYQKNTTRSISGALVSDYLDFNYRICFKPQAFKYSIFSLIFDNCSQEDLDEDIDCLKLAKIHADIRAKIVFEKDYVSNYSTNICCVQHFLKEKHKQVIFISKQQDNDVCYLQNMLRVQQWNIEICQHLDRDLTFKMNEMIESKAITDGICLVKFCENLKDIIEFEVSPLSNIDEKKSQVKLERFMSNCILFLVKKDTISCSGNQNEHGAIKDALKKNMMISKMWHITVLYKSLNNNTVELINYALTDRHKSINGQIFECY